MQSAALQAILDERDLSRLVTRMSVGMDLRDYQMFRDAWADEVDMDVPPMGGDSVPLAGILRADDYARGVIAMVSEFTVTQHVSTNHLITLEGDSAKCVSYVVGYHVLADKAPDATFVVGARYDFTGRRLPQGWRIVQLKWTPLWTTGNEGLFPEVARRLSAKAQA